MPVLSFPLPVSFAGPLSPVFFPIRVPFPMMRIGSILPYSLSLPLKESLLALFKLAWSNKVQLPVLITVCFLALDIRLQLEINIFWEPPRHNRQRERTVNQRNEPNHNHAVIAATLLHRQRQRILLQERARQLRREIDEMTAGRHNHPSTRSSVLNQLTGFEETDTDSEDSVAVESQVSARGSEQKKMKVKRRRLRKKYKSKTTPKTTSTTNPEEDDSEESEDENTEKSDDDDSTLSSDDDDSDEDPPDDPDPHLFNGFSEHHDFFDDNGSGGMSDNDDDDSSGGGTPLVVELEIRQRPVFTQVTSKLCSVVRNGWSMAHLLKNEIVEAVPLFNPTTFNRLS